ncbi:hypothetical protein [Photobacterium iliopiscarium]|uniref:NERD domain-containing protein n=1 Tax=Photobacterium iliopiscarium TaxID=56192 RepID=A0A2T3MNV7_9GAMM|nr:hypothetical protein [Photobacterium iliopiscarium]PSV98313.1 hypothetical protein C9I88_06520 [Photobacterium iliopiscarium]
MSFFDIVNKLEQLKNTEAILIEVKKLSPVQVTKKEFSKGIEDLGKYIHSNQHRKAIVILSLLILRDPNKTISTLRREGMLRVSRYKFSSSGVKKIVETSLALIEHLKISGVEVKDTKIQYLQSVNNLIAISFEVRVIREKLAYRINSRETIILKTLLAFINKCFSDGWMPNPEASVNMIEHWSTEELTEAYSYILKISREKLSTSNNWIYVDTNFGTSFNTTYADILINSIKVNLYLEAEVLLDGLPYKAELEKNQVHLLAIDTLFEKSVRLGYIQADMQRAIRVARLNEKIDMSNTIGKFTSAAFKAGMEELMPIIKEPIERIVFMIPAIDYFFEPITQKNFFADEIARLTELQIESYMGDDENPLFIPVSKELTVEDVIRTQRLFGFFSAAFTEKLNSIKDEDYRKKMYFRSVIPVLKHADLKLLLEKIFTSVKAERLIELLTLREDESYIDLQYKPLIKHGDFYVVSPALLQQSNLARNIVVANNLRSVQVDEKNDPLQKTIVKELIRAGFKVAENIDFKIDRKKCETDIVCWKEEHLFIFECKNPYHPCNPHELRNSLGHIDKGKEQLDLRLSWLKDHKNQEKLFKDIKWNLTPTDNIHTSIISGNRLLHGLCAGIHPVRQGHEFMNVLSRGIITHSNSSDAVFSFWEGKNFIVKDLINYLNGESIIRIQLEKLEPHQYTINFKDTSLTFHRYRMDVSKILHEIIPSQELIN